MTDYYGDQINVSLIRYIWYNNNDYKFISKNEYHNRREKIMKLAAMTHYYAILNKNNLPKELVHKYITSLFTKQLIESQIIINEGIHAIYCFVNAKLEDIDSVMIHNMIMFQICNSIELPSLYKVNRWGDINHEFSINVYKNNYLPWSFIQEKDGKYIDYICPYERRNTWNSLNLSNNSIIFTICIHHKTFNDYLNRPHKCGGIYGRYYDDYTSISKFKLREKLKKYDLKWYKEATKPKITDNLYKLILLIFAFVYVIYLII